VGLSHFVGTSAARYVEVVLAAVAISGGAQLSGLYGSKCCKRGGRDRMISDDLEFSFAIHAGEAVKQNPSNNGHLEFMWYSSGPDGLMRKTPKPATF
jgi:hypothetical protein